MPIVSVMLASKYTCEEAREKKAREEVRQQEVESREGQEDVDEEE